MLIRGEPHQAAASSSTPGTVTIIDTGAIASAGPTNTTATNANCGRSASPASIFRLISSAEIRWDSVVPLLASRCSSLEQVSQQPDREQQYPEQKGDSDHGRRS